MSKEIRFTGRIQETRFINARAILYKGRPLSDIPKTYKKVGIVEHNIGNSYNSQTLTVFRGKDGTFRYEIYRDGSIYPYYGKFAITDISDIVIQG